MSHIIANQEDLNPDSIDIAFSRFAQNWEIPSEIRNVFSVSAEVNTPSHLLLKCHLHFEDGKQWLVSSFDITEKIGKYFVHGIMDSERNHDVEDQTCSWLSHLGEGPVISLRSSAEFFEDFKDDMIKASIVHTTYPEKIRAYFEIQDTAGK